MPALKLLRPGLYLALVLSAVFLLSGCGGGNVVCTENIVPALSVNVTNADTKKLISGATVTVQDGSYTTTLRDNGGIYEGADERAGTYSVHVAKAGYQSYDASNIIVTRDQCHVQTVGVNVALQQQVPSAP